MPNQNEWSAADLPLGLQFAEENPGPRGLNPTNAGPISYAPLPQNPLPNPQQAAIIAMPRGAVQVVVNAPIVEVLLAVFLEPHGWVFHVRTGPTLLNWIWNTDSGWKEVPRDLAASLRVYEGGTPTR